MFTQLLLQHLVERGSLSVGYLLGLVVGAHVVVAQVVIRDVLFATEIGLCIIVGLTSILGYILIELVERELDPQNYLND